MTDNSHQRIAEAYAIAFNTPTGVTVLDHLHKRFYDNDTFDKDPYVHARNAGQRSVVRFIMQMISQPQRDHQQAQQEQGDEQE